MTSRERALSVKLWWCVGECAGDALLCRTHQQIQQQIDEAIAASTVCACEFCRRLPV